MKMIYMHKNLIDKNLKTQSVFKDLNEKYSNFREKIDPLDFDRDESFDSFAEHINKYDKILSDFVNKNNISSQRKIKSSFYEEICSYLFAKLLKNQKYLNVYTSGICVSLKIGEQCQIYQETKNVDFCIGQEIKRKKDKFSEIVTLKRPIIAIEVKTYTDATMLKGIQHTSEEIMSVSPHSKTYVLSGYFSSAKQHLYSIQHVKAFSLRKNKNEPMLSEAIKAFYKEVKKDLLSYLSFSSSPKTGKITTD